MGGWRLVSIDQVPVRVFEIVMAGDYHRHLVNRDRVNVMMLRWDNNMVDDMLNDLNGMGHCMVHWCSVVNDWGLMDWRNMVNDWGLV